MPQQFSVLLSGFDPRIWRPFARNLRTSAGWAPPMFLIAIAGVVGFSAGFTHSIIIAKTLVYLWAIPWVITSLLACSLAAADSCRNLFRFGIVGIRRPRFWFEAARTSWIVGTQLTIVTLIIAHASLSMLDVLGVAIASCFATFFLASTTGYLVGVATRRKAMGRAKECVNFFYPLVLATVVLTCFLFTFPGNANDPSSYVPALALLVVVCLAGAALITLIGRWRGNVAAG